MATKQLTKGKPPAKLLTSAQLRKLWPEIRPQPLLEKLREAQPDKRWSSTNGTELVGCCPYHNESTPSFRIYLSRGYAKCFGCGHIAWNPVSLWSTIKKISSSEALTELKASFQVKLVGSSNIALQEWERNQQLKREISIACHTELVDALSLPQRSAYEYAYETVDYLLKTRHLPLESIHCLDMLGIMPPVSRVMDHLNNFAAIENEKRENAARANATVFEPFISLAEEAQRYLTDITTHFQGGLVFRMDLAPDCIGRLKIRKPGTHHFVVVDDAFEEHIGFFGLGWDLYRNVLATGGSNQAAYIVEGEFDALTTMAHQVALGGPNIITISCGGGYGATTRVIDELYDCGFEEVFLFADAPHNKGNDLIKAWLPSVKKLRTKIFTGWDAFPGSTDPDEAVLQHGIETVCTKLRDVNNTEIFVNPPEWVFDMAKNDILPLPENDVRHRIEVAAEWGKLLRNPLDCDVFIDHCVTSYAFPLATLKREVTAKEEDERAWIMRIVSELEAIFQVVAQTANDSGRRLYLWHRKQRKMLQVELADDTSTERELSAVLGPPYEFCTDKLGVPPFLDVPDAVKNGGVYLQDLNKKVTWYLRQALLIMSQDVADFQLSKHMGPGIHVRKDDIDQFPRIYVVNGRDVYYGTYDPQRKLSWKKLDGPTHDGIIFDVGIHYGEEPWMPWVRDVKDLEKAYTYDASALYTEVRKMLDIGWAFRNQGTTVDFLAAQMFALTISDAFRRKPMLAIHADTSSGKSRLLMGLIGGVDFPRIHLIAAAVGISKFTSAGIRQRMNNLSRPLCLDEFEDEGQQDKKSKVIQELYDEFRNSVGENPGSQQGSRSGTPVNFRMSFPICIAAITKARRPQDANRSVPIYINKIQGREDPVMLLMREFGSSHIKSMKEKLSILLIPHILELYEIYEEMETEYSKPGMKPMRVDTRFFESLFPAVSIMKYLKLDYAQFLTDFCEANKESLAIATEHADSQDIFNWICQSSLLENMNGDQRIKLNLLQMLVTKDLRALINDTHAGLYYDEASQLLIVHWVDAQQHIFTKHPRWGRETNLHNLREMAGRISIAVKSADLINSGALVRLQKYGLLAVGASQLTAFRMGSTLSSLSPASAVLAAGSPGNVLPIKVEGSVTDPTPIKESKSDDGDIGS